MITINLSIYTPQGLVYKNDILTLETTTFKGRIGMCANQIPLIGLLKANLTTIKHCDGLDEFYIANGVIYQKPKKIKIFTNNLLSKQDLNSNNKWLIQKQNIENKLKQTNDEILIFALNQQLKDINNKLELIKPKQENNSK